MLPGAFWEILECVGDRFLENIITMDETPLFLYVPESRRESQEWKLSGEANSKKMRPSTCHKKYWCSLFSGMQKA